MSNFKSENESNGIFQSRKERVEHETLISKLSEKLKIEMPKKFKRLVFIEIFSLNFEMSKFKFPLRILLNLEIAIKHLQC